MRNIRYTLVALLSIVFSSCEDKLDEVLPRDSLAPESVSSASDIERLLVGAYDGIQNTGTNSVGASLYYLSALTEDLSADNLKYRATFFQHGEVDANAILTGNVLVQRYYLGPWVPIYRANEIVRLIEGIDASDFSTPQRKDEIVGEALYMRALAYFRLVSLFGGVPLVLESTAEELPRATEDAIWNQIATDLDESILKAPDFNGTNVYITKQAAKALRARVALYREDYALAATLAEELIANSSFALATNATEWRSIFDSPGSSSEIIFQIETTLTEGSSSHGFFLMDAENPFGTGGRLELPVDESLVNAFEAGDYRDENSFVPTTARPGFFQATKYPGGGNGDDNFFISRIAEMYLTSAEAAAKRDNNPASGIARLNEVRTNRGLTAISTPANMQAFEDAVLQERRVELAFEGFRWADLRRTGRAIATLPNVTNANQLYYPIPQQAMDRNSKLVQNDGY
ncbi:MAG: RagB/SusD family nutrient uptake outer membrane protein [Fulvivirga sp.]|uniref:RagB/SusD family nutrient uptake outer membrane protein n=1 Tax=Fulvivirga sp. TaxID=1931237 RepID=UPI0032FF76E1